MLSKREFKRTFIFFFAVFFPCFLFLSIGYCEEIPKPNVMPRDEIIKRLGGPESGTEDGEIHTMGARPVPQKLSFATDPGGGREGDSQGSIPFDYNSFAITDAAKPQLDELGEALITQELSRHVYEIAGHTDARGSAEYNLDLSLKRARAVKNYLLEHFNIPAGNLRAKGYGKTRLVAEGNDEAAHARNRRVEIVRINGEKVRKTAAAPAPAPAPAPRARVLQGGLVAQVLYLDDKSGRMKKICSNTVLRSGRNPYQIFYRASHPCYVYVLQESSDGKWQILFPQKDSGTNPVKPGKDYWLPGYDSGFLLDDTKGTETIYVLASQAQISDLESTQLPMRLSEAKLPTDAHQVKTLGLERIGKLKDDANSKADEGPQVSLNLQEIIDRVVNQGGVLNRISFSHQ